MSIWGRVFAAMYDRAMARTEDAGLRDARRELLAQARGRVIEIGASEPGLAKWQDRLDGFQRRIAHGCHADRDTAAALARAGFDVHVEATRLPKAPKYVRPAIRGTATAP